MRTTVLPLLSFRNWVPVEEELGPLDFGFTTYYDDEMGPGIRRWLWAFADLVDRSELARIKCLTNRVEQTYSVEGRRRFNLDPGLMTLGNFVLATGKDNAHRIYLSDGIFGDLTLIFRGGSYRPLEWTYPGLCGFSDNQPAQRAQTTVQMETNAKDTMNNPIRSMTGFGRGRHITNEVELVTEVKAVNHRFLDISVRLPRVYGPLEPQVRKLISEKIGRGKIDVTVTRSGGKGGIMEVVIDDGLAASFHRSLAQLKER